jgi:hypothetical protein
MVELDCADHLIVESEFIYSLEEVKNRNAELRS